MKMTINMYKYGCVTKNNAAVAYFPLILLRDRFRNKNEIYFDKVYISRTSNLLMTCLWFNNNYL